ncbi:MAG TPA: RraA family protein [Roseiarcus sp.]|nr:RraA family protein [Roseiarcus sp.]
MIEEPPLLTAARRIERPSQDEVERFRGAPTSFICDAMGGEAALDFSIKPITPLPLLGVALTCQCGPADVLPLKAAVAWSQPGDVIVVATGEHTNAAVVGDLLLGVAKNRGAAGFVTDGLIRDLVDVETLNLPVYARGVSPNSPHSKGPGSVGLPIVCGGRTIASGDIIVGDRDGVVVIPRGAIAEALKNLERVKAQEAAALERVKGGSKKVEDITPLPPNDRIRWLD